eukprot:scaffold4.g4730.t1
MTSREPPLSVVQDYGAHASSCGYCGGAGGSMSHGMAADRLSVECYQELLDRGWRRSGCWVYRPLHAQTCCQLITIRLDALRFAPSRDQRRVQRRWQAYLEGAPMPGHRAEAAQGGQGQAGGSQQCQEQRQGQHEAPQPAAASHAQPPSARELAVAVQAAAAAAAGSSARWGGSGSMEVQGGSPKRHYDEIDASWPPAGADERPQDGTAGAAAQEPGQQQESGEQHGGGKRARGAAAAAVSGGQRQQTGPGQVARSEAQPVVREPSLASHLRTAIQLQATGAQQAQQVQQPGARQGEQAGAARAEGEGSAGVAVPDAAAALTAGLQAALLASVDAGELPAVSYPAPHVQQPSARQRKALPAGSLTTAFALAVAAAAARSRRESADSAGSASPRSPDAVAEALLARLPLPAGASAAVVGGHINFSLSQEQGSAGQQHAQHPKQQKPRPGGRGAGAPGAAAATGVVAVPRGVPRHFELRMLPSSDPSLLLVEFPLYKRYQMIHHGDEPGEVTLKSFKRFLIDSPLQQTGPELYPPGACPPSGFGSFHQQARSGSWQALGRGGPGMHWLEGRDMGPLSLGKLTSLQEIEWVREAVGACPSMHYYYLGFYLHTCHRMRYKGDFAPSDLLCPTSQCWVPLERARPALEAAPAAPAVLCDVPGALEGLGMEHRVVGGRPAAPPRRPSEGELERLRLALPGGGGGAPRVVAAGDLCGGGRLPPPVRERLLRQLGGWAELVGPDAWPMLAYKL